MRILQVAEWWEVSDQGGVTSMMQDLIGELEKKHEVQLLIGDWSAPHPVPVHDGSRIYHRLRLAGPPRGRFNFRKWGSFLVRFPQSVRRLLRFCETHRIDVAHLHYLSPYQLVFAAARRLGGPPFIVTVHRGDILTYPSDPALARWAKRRILLEAEYVTVVSHWLAEITRTTIGCIALPKVVHNGFSLDNVLPSSRLVIESHLEMALPERFAVIAANMRPYKGHDVALHAWAKLKDSWPDFPLVVVGGGPDFEAMRRLAADLGLGHENVMFLGSQPRNITLGLIREAAIYIAPSRSEGYSIVLLEAAALGTPIVCSDIPPFKELMQTKDAGYIFPVDDVSELRNTIFRVLYNYSSALKRANLLKNTVCREYSVATMADKYDCIYKYCISPTRA